MRLNRMPLWVLMLTVLLLLSGCGGGSGGETNTNTSNNVATYGMTYDGNGNTGGSVPVDTTYYEEGDMVTVMGNSGNLARSGYAFSGWDTDADGSGDSYAQGDQFNMGTQDVDLYAQWTYRPTP